MARRTAAQYTCLLLCILAVSTTRRNPAAAFVGASKPRAHDHRPDPLIVFVHENRIPANETSVIAFSRSGTGEDFGSIVVTGDPLRTSKAEDSPRLGELVGLIVVAKDSLFLTLTYVLSLPGGRSGSIQIQGATDPDGNGKLSIMGGTGDFLWASGSMDLTLVKEEYQRDVVWKSAFYLN